MAPHISIIVVTWNGLHLLEPFLAAMATQTVPHELVIVDNGSHDGTVDWLKVHAPDATLVALASNTGFAGGNNAGFRAASGEFLVLLNNDTVPPPNTLADLVAPFEQNPRLGATAGVLVFAHRPDLVASAGIIAGRDGVHRDLWATEQVATLPTAPTPVFGASGGAMAVRRTALSDIGAFDDGFFAYLEDADLAWRLRLRRWETLVVPSVLVPHIYSATSGQGSSFKQRLLARNRWRLLIRCWPAALLIRALPSILVYDLLAAAFALLKRQPAIVTGRLSILRDLPALLHERRTLQQRRTAATAELFRWLTPSLGIRGTLREARALDKVLRER